MKYLIFITLILTGIILGGGVLGINLQGNEVSPISDVLIIVYSSLSALYITIGISTYFRYKLQPLSEQIFINNRNSFFERTFSRLEMFDEYWFKYILDTFTDEFGELKRDRKEVLKNTFKFASMDELKNQKPMDLMEGMKESEKLRELRNRFEVEINNM